MFRKVVLKIVLKNYVYVILILHGYSLAANQ